MSIDRRRPIPRWVSVAIAFVLVATFAYAVVFGPIFLWAFGVVSTGLFLFVIYLFYRLVIAVERIADGD